MTDASVPFVVADVALAAFASLAWAVGLLMALPRYRAFRQTRDLWWVLAFACLLVVGMGFGWEAWRMLDRDAVAATRAWPDLVRRIAFALAGVAAVQGYRHRTDAFDR